MWFRGIVNNRYRYTILPQQGYKVVKLCQRFLLCICLPAGLLKSIVYRRLLVKGELNGAYH
jgi:hypothetical protein